MNAHDLITKLGRHEVAESLNIGITAVNNALYRKEKKLPPSWFAVVSELAEAKGINCPVSLFAMKGIPSADAPVTSEVAK